MSNEIQRFDFKGAVLRTLTDEAGEPWFVAKDVCDVLGYTNASKAISDHVDLEDKLNNESLSSLGQRGGWLVNESGLYSLVLSSKLPTAKEFKRWVTHEVLPQIRRTGGYIPTTDVDDDMTILAKAVMIGQRTMEEQKRRIAAQESHINELEPKARFADAVAASDGTCLIGGTGEDAAPERFGHRPEPTVRDPPTGRLFGQERLEPQCANTTRDGLGTVPHQGNRHHPFGRPRDHQPHREGHRQRPDILHQPLLPTRRP